MLFLELACCLQSTLLAIPFFWSCGMKLLSDPKQRLRTGYGRGLAAAAAKRRECSGAVATVRLQRRRCSLGFARVPAFG